MFIDWVLTLSYFYRVFMLASSDDDAAVCVPERPSPKIVIRWCTKLCWKYFKFFHQHFSFWLTRGQYMKTGVQSETEALSPCNNSDAVGTTITLGRTSCLLSNQDTYAVRWLSWPLMHCLITLPVANRARRTTLDRTRCGLVMAI